jgi:membrane protein DedA with SNARE-associated domain
MQYLKMSMTTFRSRFSKFITKLKRKEKKLLLAWIRFSRDHRDSSRLPLVFFILLFVDGFVMIVPSIVCLIAAVTITPKKWSLFAGLAVVASILNNVVIYFIARMVPVNLILHVITTFKLDLLWIKAKEYLAAYGSFSTFMTSMLGLPTQMVTALIGMTDAEIFKGHFAQTSTLFIHAAFFAFLGSSLKLFCVAGAVRFGWVKLEKKFGKEA